MYDVQAIQTVTFNFGPTTTSTATQTQPISVPNGANLAMAYLQGFNVYYTNQQQFGFGNLQVAVTANSLQQLQCTVTLRDNYTNKRQWAGSVTAVAVSYSGQPVETRPEVAVGADAAS